MNRLMVALDGSTQANAALTVARDLALQRSASLLMVHAASEQSPSAEARQAIETEYAHELTERARAADLLPWPGADELMAGQLVARHAQSARLVNTLLGETLLAEARARVADAGLVEMDSLLLHGDPADRLIELAKARAIDTIVMGCRGLGRVRPLLFGSVSQAVAHAAPCEVIMVR